MTPLLSGFAEDLFLKVTETIWPFWKGEESSNEPCQGNKESGGESENLDGAQIEMER
jgi:hypothetical protein